MTAALLITILLFAQDNESDRVRIVTSGEILKIDAKKQTFQFRITLDAFPRGTRPRPTGRRGRFPTRVPENTRLIPVIEVKVYASAKTSVDFSNLRVGDRVSIIGTRRGKTNDIDAISVEGL